jgi:hypothetical protein
MRKLNTLPSANVRKLPNCTRLPRPVELPQAPEVGKFYVYKGRKVQCVASDNCDECVRPCDEIYCSSLFSFDKVSIKVIPAN